MVKIGISEDKMTRLGFKYSAATASLSFEAQARDNQTSLTKAQRGQWGRLKGLLGELRARIDDEFAKVASRVSSEDILEYLEFQEVHLLDFSEAFRLREEEDGFSLVGADGKAISSTYFLDHWMHGTQPGV